MVVSVGSKNIAGSFIKVVEKEGWKGLFAGNAVNMIRIVPTQAIKLATFKCVKRSMTSFQEKWKQEERPHVQIGNINLSLSFSWISPIAVAGAAAGVVSTLVCHPLKVLKDRLTISPVTYPNLTVAIRRIYKDSGVGGFYAGLFPTLVGMLPYNTCYYFMYETIKKSYYTMQKKKFLSRVEMLFIRALSGFMASTISFPLEVMRKRLIVGALEGKCPLHMVAVVLEVIHNEGMVGALQRLGHQLPESHAFLRNHLDVLRSVERHTRRQPQKSCMTFF